MFWQASEISPLIHVDSGVVVPVIADRFVGSQEYVEEVKSLCDGYQVRYYGTMSYEDEIKFLQTR